MKDKKVFSLSGAVISEIPFRIWNYNDPKYEGYTELLRDCIYGHLRNYEYGYCICGGLEGVDLNFAEEIMDFRDELFYDIKLEIVLPYRNHDIKWRTENRLRLNYILRHVDKITYISQGYTSDCLRLYKEYLVDKSDSVNIFYNSKKKRSFANKIIEYAKNANKKLALYELDLL